jgi:hypothetical protein
MSVVQPSNGTLRRRGASVQSWRAATPRAVLEQLVEVHGTRDRAGLLRKFEEHVRANDSLLSTVVEYWFTNNLNSLIAAQQRATPQHAAQVAAIREKAARDVRETVTKAVEARARLMLLDLKMPNGKRLRACTGAECRALSATTGRWLAAIAKEVPAKQKVGEAITEDRLHELYEAAQ